VRLSYRPQGGAWVTQPAFYSPLYNTWSIYWTIPEDASTGLYDVKIDVSNPTGGSASNMTLGQFNLASVLRILDLSFSDSSNPIKDASGHGNIGTLHNATWLPSYGGCYSFNGVNSYINRQNVSSLPSTPISFSFWSRQLGTETNFMHLVGLFGDQRATVYVSPGTYTYSYKFSNVSNTSLEGSIATLDLSWHHFAVVFNGSQLDIYVDGINKVDVPVLGVINKVDDSLFIGTAGTGTIPAGNYFNGLMNDVRVYSRVLSAVEVQAEYNAGKAQHGIS
jgi:hypothetical protein